MTTRPSSSHPDATAVDRYLAALNEPDAVRRRALIEQAWTPQGSLTDPPMVGEGHDGLAARRRRAPPALRRAPLRADQRRSTSHHGRYRFAWALVGPGGATRGHRHGHGGPRGRRPRRRGRRLLRRARSAG